jgi:hypothetical protein
MVPVMVMVPVAVMDIEGELEVVTVPVMVEEIVLERDWVEVEDKELVEEGVFVLDKELDTEPDIEVETVFDQELETELENELETELDTEVDHVGVIVTLPVPEMVCENDWEPEPVPERETACP